MTELREGQLQFEFDADVTASKYDDWAHYRRQLSKLDGMKAVDIVCCRDRDSTGWLIEVKDFSDHPRTKPSDLPEEVAVKVIHTLAGLVAARFQGNVSDEKELADRILTGSNLRVVLHLEQPRKPSRLKPSVYDPVSLRQKLKGMLKAVDPRVQVVSRGSPAHDAPWTVRRLPR